MQALTYNNNNNYCDSSFISVEYSTLFMNIINHKKERKKNSEQRNM